MSTSAVATATVDLGGTAGAANTREKQQRMQVESYGSFPMVGSRLGDYFCLGKLGKGTFCSIHKCCALDYWRTGEKARIVAAKVELSTFTNSGVLDGEAHMLGLLDRSLPPNTVPLYLGHLSTEREQYSAIIMEYLGGNDMHQLREELGTRRISVEDAVFLTADVFIPLLREMHGAGVVHRDVKPSNCVRRDGKEFLLVDFGLSKSIVVSKDSPHAAKPFNDIYSFRVEREKADFRGTSMYASLRVHQLKDYAFRDDMWSVLYVFCDLVSGGLPWMSYAANRDRETCEKMKKDIFEQNEAATLLKGEAYFIASFKRDKMEQDGKTDLPPLPEPLALSKDVEKVALLSEAFLHVGALGYEDTPNYELLREKLHGFLKGPSHDETVPKLQFQSKESNKGRFSPLHEAKQRTWDAGVPCWDLAETRDPLEYADFWESAKLQAETEDSQEPPPKGEAGMFARLPVEFQFRIAQMNYHARHAADTPHHIALQDFMKVALPLLHGEWDCAKFEGDNHKSSDHSFRRELYLKVIEMCIACAAKFKMFSSRECYYVSGKEESKRRRIISTLGKGELVAISKVIVGLKAARNQEMQKGSAPPPELRFS